MKIDKIGQIFNMTMISLTEKCRSKTTFQNDYGILKQLPVNLCKYEFIGLYLTLESIRRLLQIKNRTQ